VHVIAGASPDNTPAGYYWTFLFPMLLFIVIALILWALFGRPHQRIPAHRIQLGLSSPGGGPAGLTATAAGAAAAPGGASPLPAGAESDPPASADETDGGQPAADGAGAGE
jgi:hypothetical protein